VTDLLAILTSNAPAWGVTLTLIIAGLVVSVVLLYRYIVRLEVEIAAVKDKVDNKVSDLYDLVNSVARDVSWVKGRMEGDK
jgi:hypothetical protein